MKTGWGEDEIMPVLMTTYLELPAVPEGLKVFETDQIVPLGKLSDVQIARVAKEYGAALRKEAYRQRGSL